MGRAALVALLFSLALTACGGDDDGAAFSPFQELADQGLTRYLGTAEPIGSTELANGETVFEFDATDGPICLHGGPFRAAVRHRDSPDLVLYLQGGGACSSAVCIVTFDDTETIYATGVPAAGILNPTLAANPVHDWNVVYTPYCDGSLMMGDIDRDVDGDGEIEHQQGLRNLSAAVDLAAREFPRPHRILLTGISAGGFATFTALPLVRERYPDAEILVLNDSGVGIGVPGEVDGAARLVGEFNAAALLPASCEGCFDRGHLMPLLGWQLERDPNVRAAMISSLGDFVITVTFVGIPAADFATALRSESGAIAAAFPDRFKRFLYPGTRHTVLGVDASSDLRESIDVGIDIDIEFLEMILGRFDVTSLDGRTVADWVTSMIADQAWPDLVSPEN